MVVSDSKFSKKELVRHTRVQKL